MSLWGYGCWWAEEIEWPWCGLRKDQIERAIWDGDTGWLDLHLGCGCCCHEHTFEGCPARMWNGCRGQYSSDYDDESWARFYETAYGMTREQFFG